MRVIDISHLNCYIFYMLNSSSKHLPFAAAAQRASLVGDVA